MKGAAMFENRKIWLVVATCLAMHAPLSGCGRKEGASAEVAIIPGANLVVALDIAATSDSAIYRKLKVMQEEQTGALPPGLDGVEALAEMTESAEKILGLKDTDFVRMAFSAKFLGDDLEAMLQENLADNLEAAMAVELKKAVTLDQLEQFINALAEKGEDTPVISRETVGGEAALAIRGGTSDEEETMYLTTLAKGKLILGGTRDGVANAIKRSGKPIKVSDALAGSGLPAGALPHWLVAVVLSDAMKAEMNETLAEAAAEPGMGANVAQSLMGMSGAVLGVDMGAAIDMGFHVELASAAKAETLKTLFENVALSGLKMGVTMMTDGQPLPMLDSMKATTAGGTASLALKIGERDIDMIHAVAKRQMQQMQDFE